MGERTLLFFYSNEILLLSFLQISYHLNITEDFVPKKFDDFF